MKLIDAEYTFDNNKVLFYFTADGRIDFRELVKDLAGVFRTRIELRQIGVRDETKIRGGIGICGRPLCCSTYLTEFAPGVYQDGQGAEPVPQPEQDLRRVRPPYVLPHERGADVRGAEQPAAFCRGYGDHPGEAEGGTCSPSMCCASL